MKQRVTSILQPLVSVSVIAQQQQQHADRQHDQSVMFTPNDSILLLCACDIWLKLTEMKLTEDQNICESYLNILNSYQVSMTQLKSTSQSCPTSWQPLILQLLTTLVHTCLSTDINTVIADTSKAVAMMRSETAVEWGHLVTTSSSHRSTQRTHTQTEQDVYTCDIYLRLYSLFALL